MDFLTRFLEQAFSDYAMIYVDVLTYCNEERTIINPKQAIIELKGDADELLKQIEELGLFVEYFGLHHWRISYQCEC